MLCLCPSDCPCLAEYSDGVYYRAKIVKFVSLEPVRVMVHHVDFGSDDTLPTSKYDCRTPQKIILITDLL